MSHTYLHQQSPLPMNFFRGRLGIPPILFLALLLACFMANEVVVQAATTTHNTITAATTDTATNTDATTATDSTATSASSAQTTHTTTSDDFPSLSTSTSTSSTSTSSTSTSSTSDSASTTDSSLPTISTSTDSSSSSTSTYAIPVATVPPTANAPYMRKSNVPEGTVFIVVGAVLGFIGLSVLAWRALVAWSINRSVRRAAMEQAQSENKALLRHKRKSRRHSRHRSHGPRGTAVSMEKLSMGHRQSHLPAKVPSTQTSLFYSPTAGAGMHHAANRGSSYLPAGYYSAGSAAPGAGHSRTNLGPSPPGSPSLPPSSGQDAPFNRMSHAGASSSTLNLNVPPQGRAPSAYLEDLFESHTPATPGDHSR